MSFRPKFFRLEELVDPDTYEQYGENAWLLFDDRALWTLDQLRERFGSCFVNNWPFGGANKYGGFRAADCPIGAKFSQHKAGRAFDAKFKGVSAEEVRQDILSKPFDAAYQFIMALESGVSWCHFDTRLHDKVTHGIKVFGA